MHKVLSRCDFQMFRSIVGTIVNLAYGSSSRTAIGQFAKSIMKVKSNQVQLVMLTRRISRLYA